MLHFTRVNLGVITIIDVSAIYINSRVFISDIYVCIVYFEWNYIIAVS